MMLVPVMIMWATAFLALGPSGGGLRVNKVLSDKVSRREADRLVSAGRVTINGKKAAPGDLVNPGDFVKLDGKRVAIPQILFKAALAPKALNKPLSSGGADKAAKNPRNFVYLIYHKPKGIECTTDQSIAGNVVDAIGHPQRIFPVGRLDKDTSGALLMTSDGRLPDACLRAEHGLTKTYEVTVDLPVRPEDCKKLAQGVVITTTSQSNGKTTSSRTLPCSVHPIENTGCTVLKIKLKEGRNRQIRKMLRAVGYSVKRVS